VSDLLQPPYPIPTTVPTDPVLVEFYPEFVDRWIADFTDEWPRIMERHDPVELHRFGHTIKGSFVQFAMRDHSKIGIEIMQCADRDDWERAATCVDGLRQMMIELKAHLANHPPLP
jgi:hypothetical protein